MHPEKSGTDVLTRSYWDLAQKLRLPSAVLETLVIFDLRLLSRDDDSARRIVRSGGRLFQDDIRDLVRLWSLCNPEHEIFVMKSSPELVATIRNLRRNFCQRCESDKISVDREMRLERNGRHLS